MVDWLKEFYVAFPNYKFKAFPSGQSFLDDNFKFDENGQKFSKSVEEVSGKGEIVRNR